jgi:coproporphyrinogen III oxidase-like Fe-S oxidoreductase
MMRLRLSDGLSIKEYEEKFSFSLPQKYTDRMLRYIKSGHIICNDGRYSLSDAGMYVSNYILSDILDLE